MKTPYSYMLHLVSVCGLLILGAWFVSCRKFVSIDPPQNQVVTGTVFTDDQTATAAVTGLYAQMTASNLIITNGGLSVYASLSADELVRTAANTDIDAFTANAIAPANSINSNLWARAYAFIYHANACIEGLTTATAITTPVRSQLLGEMYCTRALLYFYLLNMYADVPLITTTDYNTNAIIGRTPSATVFDHVVSDLEKAKSLLTPAYPTSGRVRPNRFTASALLARVFLYKKAWASAEAEATEVISSNLYTCPPVNENFLATSNETIWQLIPVVNGANTAEGATFIPSSASTRPNYAITAQLLAAFETGDARRTAWIKTNTVSGTPYSYPNKYKVRSATAKTEYNIVLRLAELLLIRAEARAQLDKLPEARNDINAIRTRALLPNLTTGNKDTLLQAIAKERRIELFAEWGHRWFDLKRTDKATLALSPVKTGWVETAVLYPIPQQELQRNPFLFQNPGY